MEKVTFTKMSGAGNDFIVIDKNSNSHFVLSDSAVQKLCSRRNGIGSDGLITIENSPEYDFLMGYYNADGSHGSLCGNGARCAVYFAGLTGRVKNGKTVFASNNIKYSGEILGEEKVRFYLNPPYDTRLNFELKAGGAAINASFTNTGSPHVVISLDDLNRAAGAEKYKNINELPVFELGREIRYLKEFAPGGTNVNFIQVSGKKIYIRTYERGVEDETLACGTGATASALIGNMNFNLQPPISLITFGGDELIVDYQKEEKEIKNLSLTGPVKVVYTGEFLLNKFL
ncbi:MAG: diaminopimelate epimerase [Ignavibacteriaceae bacterium]